MTLGTGSHPLGDAVSCDEHLHYVLVNGFHEINGYRIGPDDSLTQSQPVVSPAGPIGTAVS